VIIGITGSFGSGKTTVSKMFKRLGAYVIDADKICHSLMFPSKKVYKKIVRNFGKDILKKDKTINRKVLAGVVFKKESALGLLNKIVHPEAIREIKNIVRSNKKRKVIVVDAALLLESGFYKDMDKLVVIKTKKDKQVKRLALSKGMEKSQILQRLKMQDPLKKKLALADFIIDNNGTKKKTFIQVKKIWKQTRGVLCQ